MEGVADQCADKPGGPRRGEDTDTEMGLAEDTSNPAPDGSPGSGPKPTESKPKYAYAFVEIVELNEEEMPTSYLEAPFGEPYGARIRLAPFLARSLS